MWFHDAMMSEFGSKTVLTPLIMGCLYYPPIVLQNSSGFD